MRRWGEENTHVFEEDLEHATGLLIDEARDTLHTTTTRETTDGGLSDTLDVITKNLSVTLRTTLSKAFATFAACREVLVVVWMKMRLEVRIRKITHVQSW